MQLKALLTPEASQPAQATTACNSTHLAGHLDELGSCLSIHAFALQYLRTQQCRSSGKVGHSDTHNNTIQ